MAEVFRVQVKRFVLGRLATNCYLVRCQSSKEAIVIDPGGDVEPILNYIKQEGLNLRYIVNTHGHADHIQGNGELKAATGAKIIIHQEDAGMLDLPGKNLSRYTGEEFTSPQADCLVAEGDTITWGKESLQVLHTPGHTPGGISLVGDGIVFTGDTLFAGSVGRTDLPGGSMAKLLFSIKEKLLILPPDTKVLPGHGPETTIGSEKEHNPFL
jgi:hydroxyacylglutathione hydrolase